MLNKEQIRKNMGTQGNRPFPNYLWPLFQSEYWCSSFHMKISFHSHASENLFSDERMSTSTRFEKEANSNSEMAYFGRNQGPPLREMKTKAHAEIPQ